jgi:hypothetical protein
MRRDIEDPRTTSSPLDYRGFFGALATARGAKEILAISFISSFGIGCVIGVVRMVYGTFCSCLLLLFSHHGRSSGVSGLLLSMHPGSSLLRMYEMIFFYRFHISLPTDMPEYTTDMSVTTVEAY